MNISNKQIAQKLNEIADALEEKKVNHYRIRSYRNAAKFIEKVSLNLEELVLAKKDLTVFPSIGGTMAKTIIEIVTFQELPKNPFYANDFPQFVKDLKRIKGLGPKRIKVIYAAYPIKNIDELKNLLITGKIAELPRFSPKICQKILSSLNTTSYAPRRTYFYKAEFIVKRLWRYLKKSPHIDKIDVAGSYRRKAETIKNIDIVITSRNFKQVLEYFVNYPEITSIIIREDNYISAALWLNIDINLWNVPEDAYGAALYCLTGSQTHIAALKQSLKNTAIQFDLHGLFLNHNKMVCSNEPELFAALHLPYIAPELRENTQEILAANSGNLPNLVKLEDILGDLHCHTNSTDGRHTLEEMAMAAKCRGLLYMAITDHSEHLTITNGLNKERLFAQIKLIDQLNEKFDNFTILKSIELDILENGDLDLSAEILKELDIVVCSVHSKFNLSKQKQTERIIRAMDNRYFNILGHATGRLINHREPYLLDMEKVIEAAKERNCILEINSQPARLDVNDEYARYGKNLGVKFAISSDAHSIKQLDLMRLGVNQARRGWLEAADIINTHTVEDLKKIIRRG